MTAKGHKTATSGTESARAAHEDALLDDALAATFPASDPIAVSFQDAFQPDGDRRASAASGIEGGDASGRAVLPGSAAAATIYDPGVALVDTLLAAAHQRLATIADDAPLIQAAKLLRAGTDLVIVCDARGALAGVITKTDVVGVISHCLGAACMAAASTVMTRNVVTCAPGDLLSYVWSKMNTHGLKNLPVMSGGDRPVGLLNARDVLQVLLRDVQQEESMLRDYVMGVGYR